MEAGQHESPQAAEASDKLCRTYWYPLYAYIRWRGYSREDTEDLTQGFLVQLLERKSIARAVPGYSGTTDEIGEQVMTGKKTGTSTGRFYILINGLPALVFVHDCSVTYSTPTEGELLSQITGYLADANGDPGQLAFPTATYHSITRRITK